jgi:hypothetical protein
MQQGTCELLTVRSPVLGGPADGEPHVHPNHSPAAGTAACAAGGSPDLAGEASCFVHAGSSGKTSADGPERRSSDVQCPFVGVASSSVGGFPGVHQQHIVSRSSTEVSMQQGTCELLTVRSPVLGGPADGEPHVHPNQSLSSRHCRLCSGRFSGLGGRSILLRPCRLLGEHFGGRAQPPQQQCSMPTCGSCLILCGRLSWCATATHCHPQQ